MTLARHSSLHSEFHDSQGYIENSCLKQANTQTRRGLTLLLALSFWARKHSFWFSVLFLEPLTILSSHHQLSQRCMYPEEVTSHLVSYYKDLSMFWHFSWLGLLEDRVIVLNFRAGRGLIGWRAYCASMKTYLSLIPNPHHSGTKTGRSQVSGAHWPSSLTEATNSSSSEHSSQKIRGTWL